MKVTIESPEVDQTKTAVGFVEKVINCASATAVMDMEVRWNRTERNTSLV